METPLIDFVYLSDEDIYQIFMSLGSDVISRQGCIQDFHDLLLLRNSKCIVSQRELNAQAEDTTVELGAGQNFLQKMKVNSTAGSPIDFSSGGKFSGNKHMFYIYDGKAYNFRDFGNFLWALAYRLASCKREVLRWS